MNTHPYPDDNQPIHSSRWCVLDWFFLAALAALAVVVLAVARLLGV